VRLDRVLAAVEEGADTYSDGTAIRTLCMVGTVRIQPTKSGAKMAYIRVEDLYGSIEMVVFPKTLAQYEELLQAGNAVLINGRLDVQEEEAPKLICQRVEPVPDTPPALPQAPAPTKAPNPRAGLYLRLPTDKGAVYESAYNAVKSSHGDTPVYIRFVDSGKMVKAPKDWGVTLNERLLQELKRLLGSDNVAVVE